MFGSRLDKVHERSVYYRTICVPVALQTVVGKFTWHKLRCLVIGALTTSEVEIASFLRRHASTLRELHVLSLWFTSGSWEGFLAFLRDELVLEHLRMDYVCGVNLTGGGRKTYAMDQQAF